MSETTDPTAGERATWFRAEYEKAKAFNAALPLHARLVVCVPVGTKEKRDA